MVILVDNNSAAGIDLTEEANPLLYSGTERGSIHIGMLVGVPPGRALGLLGHPRCGLPQHRQSTLGDAFCGAGGGSCGARKAGVHNEWAVDFSNHALETDGRHFPTTDWWQAEVNRFRSLNYNYLRVDILHRSPPCQPSTPAPDTPTPALPASLPLTCRLH
ncbi:predicted protein [Aspergillus terreus NIH2624]|uniref:Uncharacterized protein n=1 Tax=Aspergillus terreus (strain NIH 2624 / FGSC A1156) TaxID=341663 RepID=Q0CCX0_ASPTN|nr:uncharacterized protein ATEG_08464 [Aspergillus terreus NIH2624]EAU31637.1 predicted protein [Aspergillus terreus NIH2624]